MAPATQNLPAEPEPAPDRARVAGGTLHIHLEAEPVHLNPLLDSLQVISRVVTDTIYETLLDCHGTDYLPGLAESWEVSPDGLRILIKPRGGVRWHDDRLFTVVDVQATLESIVAASSRLPLPRIMLSK